LVYDAVPGNLQLMVMKVIGGSYGLKPNHGTTAWL